MWDLYFQHARSSSLTQRANPGPLHWEPKSLSHQSTREGVPPLKSFKCPICSKSVASDEMEMHFIMCLSKPRLSYNDDVLTKDAGECVICLEELLQGDTIARLPCLCIYHKRYAGAGRPSSATPRHQRAPSLWWEERATVTRTLSGVEAEAGRRGRLDARSAEPRRPVDP
ncbi:hypothetical protein FD755_005809 [Muntiacus reevesi]|uniref:RING-type E3 ubiquitin transferase n=1 Tax=Muntiacus reevesi TaxID=9886 RepID=A0A5J5MWT3_MUNRE|nr:hypothetical protein FD755_005809 [Muntiacus reevesi]